VTRAGTTADTVKLARPGRLSPEPPSPTPGSARSRPPYLHRPTVLCSRSRLSYAPCQAACNADWTDRPRLCLAPQQRSGCGCTVPRRAKLAHCRRTPRIPRPCNRPTRRTGLLPPGRGLPVGLPAHTDVPEYIRLIALGQFSTPTWSTASRTCSRHPRARLRPPCEPPAGAAASRKARRDLPPQARRRRPQGLDHGPAAGRAAKKNGKRVACIGAGPLRSRWRMTCYRSATRS